MTTRKCICIKTINKMLAPKNAQLGYTLQVTDDRIITRLRIAIEGLGGKRSRKFPAIVATFCPFCGQKFPEK